MKAFFISALVLMMFASVQAQQNQRYEIVNKKIKLLPEGKEFYEKNLPAVVDNSTEMYFPPVYSQTHWVCNQVSASYYMMTYENCRIKNLSAYNPYRWFSVYVPWNWCHGGEGWFGGHVTGSFNIAKSCGMPFMYQSQADIDRDSSIWITGYDNYYDFMHNRIKDYYYIDVKDEDGLMALKAWVYDHARDEHPGGLATFMTNIGSGGDNHLPSGTPEEGFYVITLCGDNPLHSRTVVGYNDNVCWDYNGDGQYTNNIDLNGDDIIDVRDWEKGGFKLAESFGPDWQGHGGFLYIMYKCIVDDFPNGGILNNEMAVIEPLIGYEPLLTAKVNLNHESRGNIKISIGVSKNVNAIEPDVELDFPILNYQGGDKYMLGGTTEADKTMEVGFDITPLLDYIDPGVPCRFFVVGRELDPNNSYTGSIQGFTIFRHQSCPPDEISWTGNMAFNSAVIHAPLTVTVNFDRPEITTEALPVFNENTAFNYYMNGTGGSLPYTWHLEAIFDTTMSAYSFDYFDDIKLTPDTYFDGAVAYTIPFEFPFNGKLITEIRISTDGYIMADSSQYPWPYIHPFLDDFFRMEKIIGPHMRYSFTTNPDYNDGIWVKEFSDHVSIRWNVSQEYLEPWTDCNFGVNLWQNGKIEFFYGPQYYNKSATGLAGISYGDNLNYGLIAKSEMIGSNKIVAFTQYPVLPQLQLSSTGILSGTLSLDEPYPVRMVLTDNNGRFVKKDFQLITGIENETQQKIRLFPNPANENLRIQIPENEVIGEIQLFDVKGSRLPLQDIISGSDHANMNISHLSNGVYTIKIITSANTYNKQFIKQ